MDTLNKQLSGSNAFSGWNNGLIYTNQNCSGCNKCIAGCPVLAANVVIADEESGQTKIMVDANKCISCGHCIKECHNYARVFHDDTADFFTALRNGESISVIVDPSFSINYPEEDKHILGYLKQLGVNHILNAAFGADITTWSYLNYLSEYDVPGAIASQCPVVVNYIERYKPALLPHLMPIHSPMICTAIYARKYMNITDKFAFIGPCIAKKDEINDPNTHGIVTYNITYYKLLKMLEDISIEKYSADDNELEYCLGAMYSMPGGLKRNIESFVGFDNLLLQLKGESKAYPFLSDYINILKSGAKLPFMVDILNCSEGCNRGSASEHGIISDYAVEAEMHQVKNSAYNMKTYPRGSSPTERFSVLNSQFKQLRLSDFIREFNHNAAVDELYMSEPVMNVIFNSMNKFTKEQRNNNCGACGYSTCSEMARAIGYEINIKDNCTFYVQERMRLENKHITALVDRITEMNEQLKESAQMKSNFLANMSHEIRTPMNAVIGMAEMALRGDMNEKERDYIMQIKASGRSLLAIINDILDFSKIESGKLEIHESEYEIISVMQDVSNIIINQIQDKDIFLTLDINPSIPSKLVGDDVRLRQMIINLANNAVKFTNHGMICIHLDYEQLEYGIRLYCSVEDTGIGIKEDDIDKLFVSFQQIDNSRNRNIEGTGLGLAITKMLANIMNGSIGVSSIYGKGSTFKFDIIQSVADESPSVYITRKNAKVAAGWITNKYINDSITTVMAQLHIKYIDCHSYDDLKDAYLEDADTIYVSYDNYYSDSNITDMKNTFYDEDDDTPVSIVVITDPRYDILDDDSVTELTLPLSCLNIAATINRKSFTHIQSTDDNYIVSFEAPEANILIVDDNVTNLTVAEGLLEPLKMKITTCTTPYQAIELVKINKYDLVFMDHMMPGMDGVEATHIIREMNDPYYKKLPIIAFTANAVGNVREMFLHEGLNDFVPKPIEMRTIISVLKKWLPTKFIHEHTGNNLTNNESDDSIPDIEGIDTAKGLEYTQSASLYKNVLSDYYRDIKIKSDLIEKYFIDEDVKKYMIEVHALKSSSKLIGALDLSNLAAELEHSASENNIDDIKNRTPALLEQYRSYIPVLERFNMQDTKNDSDLIEIDTIQLSNYLKTLINAMENLDFSTSTKIINALENFKYPTAEKDIFEKIKQAVDELDPETCENMALEWIDIRQ